MTMCISALLIAAVLFREPTPVPAVERMAYDLKTEVRLTAETPVCVRCADSEAASWVAAHLKSWYGIEPKVSAAAASDVSSDEGYRLVARPEGLTIDAKTIRGVRYALFTLRQIAERDSAGATVTDYRMPSLTIEDSPVLKFRGLHLCWFPELSTEYIERQIRMAAYHKFNTVVLESWGVFRSERQPWFGWPNGPMTKETIRRLVAVAKDLGVTLVPQVNVFGHATASRSCTGKHAGLDLHPERQSLFEPLGDTGAGWNWCLSNPAAVETVRDLVVELHGAFGNPPYFHIGCDEADVPTCASCRAADYSQLVNRHISGIAELLKSRGARALMWHDMLLKRGDSRWDGFYANGNDETAKLPKLLPKDVIVCDWYYGNDMGGTKDAKDRTSRTGDYPTLDYFSKECGFDTVTCPWEEPCGIRAQAKYAREQRLFGVLETVWHHFGGERFPILVQTAACGAWGRGETVGHGLFSLVWRQCGWDTGAPTYRETGWNDNQVSKDILGR